MWPAHWEPVWFSCGTQPTADMIFAAWQLREKCQEQNVGLFTTFVDLTKAFDTVYREGLWKIMAKFEFPAKFIAMVKQFHDSMNARVQDNGEFSQPFPVTSGSRAVCLHPHYSAWCSLPCCLTPSVTVSSVSAFSIVSTENSSIHGGCKQKSKCMKTQSAISSLQTTVHWTLVHSRKYRVAWTCSLNLVNTPRFRNLHQEDWSPSPTNPSSPTSPSIARDKQLQTSSYTLVALCHVLSILMRRWPTESQESALPSQN